MVWLQNQLGFKKFEDWYCITRKDFLKNKGSGLLLKYGNSPSKTIQSIFPEHNWLAWKFRKVPDGFWISNDNAIIFMNWLSKELKINSLDDWYHIPFELIL